MQEENKKPKNKKDSLPALSDLSSIWQELLGIQPADATAQITPDEVQKTPDEVVIPSFDSDPWSALLHASGVEVIDLQKVNLHVSDQDVEQMLEIMQEQPVQRPKDEPGSPSNKQ